MALSHDQVESKRGASILESGIARKIKMWSSDVPETTSRLIDEMLKVDAVVDVLPVVCICLHSDDSPLP